MLIHCPECLHQVSDRADACPHCGYPISSAGREGKGAEVSDAAEDPRCPDFPDDLSVGRQIVNWLGNAAVSGYYDAAENAFPGIPTGKISVVLNRRGITIWRGLTVQLPMHESLLISVRFAPHETVLAESKSVVGRAIIGGLLVGPVGALVGAVSGIGAKETSHPGYMVINFWHFTLKRPQTILIRAEQYRVTNFVARAEKEFGRSLTASL